jgi:O-antigen/teichoic acid export membrane protein
MAQRTQRLIEAARRPLPEGTFAVGAGLLIAGVTAYLFQILSFRALSKADYAALNALWVFVFVLAPGVFLPLEQEVGRAVADRRARHVGGGPVVRRAAALGLWLTVGLAIVTGIVAATTDIVDRLFEGSTGLIVCLVIALFTYCCQHLTRGTLAGNGRFGPYGTILGAEGIIRVVPCIALAVAGVSNPVWYGLCLAIPPVLGSLVSLRGQRGLMEDGPEAPWSELSTNMGYLLAGSLMAQALSYAPFLGAQLLSTPAERDLVADFIVGLFLARIPILLFQAVQAALLPKLAHLAGSGQHDDFRSGLRKLVLVVVAIGALGVLAAGTIGPTAGEILFGDKFNLGNVDLALLAAGSGLFILALTLAQALIALMGHARAVIAWALGLAVFVGVTAFVGDDLFKRVEIGFIAGAAASAAMMGALLLQRLRSDIPEGGLASLVEQIEHEPLEI